MRRSSRLRRLALTLPVALAASLGVAALTAPAASAHGSVTDPPTRNYGCWQRWGSGDNWEDPALQGKDPMCYGAFRANPDDIWNWNGLYVNGMAGQFQANIPDGQLCSGGPMADPRYKYLDTPGPWVAKDESTTFHLTLTDSAKHGADYLLIYVTKPGYDPTTKALAWSDLELVKKTGSYPTTGDYETDVTVPEAGRTGRAIVYTIWQASHMDQSYFLCSDVNFTGSGTGTPPVTTPPVTTPPVTTPPVTTPPVTTPPVTTPPVTTPPVTTPPPAGTGCKATVTLASTWPGGYQADVKVTAGSAAIKGWKVQVGGATISQAWNGTLSGSTITNAAWNGSVAAGASTSAGFLGTGSPGTLTGTCTAS
ncbi:lytic polysaccharide monooxygenase [Cellulomonas alba]|uniref:Lytic polysaccharide monooxygenase n=1 Tax=Cellulomonas alba TaxID=3053467 RepID=A0ABT7SJT7_9CELL|nr:lytic polysaccharide monooxygenase [Cellulomonas alba]MDM7856447.1 lytic polysaccharide monooxygenase [Cellulomonas alba]